MNLKIGLCLLLVFAVWIIQFTLTNISIRKSYNKIYTIADIDRRIDKILANPLYRNFNVTRQKLEKVNLLVICSTAPMRYKRRNAVRATWWKQCNQNNDTKVSSRCIFLTDHVNPSSIYYDIIKEELKNKDIYFQNLDGGVQFGLRYLYHIVYAAINFDFDYMMRVDDDYFLCFNTILAELPLPAQSNFHWGFVYTVPRYQVRSDEGIIMFSKDIIFKFINQNYSLMQCHPFADQMISIWIKDLSMYNVLRHDKRLHQHPPIKQGWATKFRNMTKICDSYIGIHGAYENDMRLLWNNNNKNIKIVQYLRKPNITLATLNKVVLHAKSSFMWNRIPPRWRFEPKPCASNPKWNFKGMKVVNGAYAGRE